jgi:hypothetical protein
MVAEHRGEFASEREAMGSIGEPRRAEHGCGELQVLGQRGVDRDTIVAAARFVLCRTDWFKLLRGKAARGLRGERVAAGRRLRAALVPGPDARHEAR